jgi:hypothetical protein
MSLSKLCILFLFLAAGCASMEQVAPGTVTVGDNLVLIADGRWNRLDPPAPEADADEAWTAEGVTLDMILFYVGVADGHALGERADAARMPAFRAGMLPHDIVELYEAMVAHDGGAFKLERLAPARFGGVPGFVFEHTTTARSGPPLRGLAYGAVVDGRLYLMSYTAPAAHFYAKHLESVHALAASARITPRESAAFSSP